jgi:hypothetical protein
MHFTKFITALAAASIASAAPNLNYKCKPDLIYCGHLLDSMSGRKYLPLPCRNFFSDSYKIDRYLPKIDAALLAVNETAAIADKGKNSRFICKEKDEIMFWDHCYRGCMNMGTGWNDKCF